MGLSSVPSGSCWDTLLRVFLISSMDDLGTRIPTRETDPHSRNPRHSNLQTKDKLQEPSTFERGKNPKQRTNSRNPRHSKKGKLPNKGQTLTFERGKTSKQRTIQKCPTLYLKAKMADLRHVLSKVLRTIQQRTNKSLRAGLDSNDLHPLVVPRTTVEHTLNVRPHPQDRASEHVIGLSSEPHVAPSCSLPALAMPENKIANQVNGY